MASNYEKKDLHITMDLWRIPRLALLPSAIYFIFRLFLHPLIILSTHQVLHLEPFQILYDAFVIYIVVFIVFALLVLSGVVKGDHWKSPVQTYTPKKRNIRITIVGKSLDVVVFMNDGTDLHLSYLFDMPIHFDLRLLLEGNHTLSELAFLIEKAVTRYGCSHDLYRVSQDIYNHHAMLDDMGSFCNERDRLHPLDRENMDEYVARL